jgi:polyhydroxyalkanoate synthesis regulator phasin
MEQKQLVKQMIDFNKATFENTFNAITMLQDQAEKMVNMFLQQATWIPEEGKKVLNEWVAAFKKGRNDFKNAIDENFKKVEDFFAKFEKP